MPNIPQIQIGSTTYEVKDKRVDKYLIQRIEPLAQGKLNEADGTVGSITTRYEWVTDYIPLKQFSFSWVLKSSAGSSRLLWLNYCVYDANKNYITGGVPINITDDAQAVPEAMGQIVIKFTDTAKYIRLSYRRWVEQDVDLYLDTGFISNQLNEIINDKEDIQTRLSKFGNGYIGDDGTINQATYNFEVYTDYIPYNHDKIGIVCKCNTAYPLWASCAFYDSSKQHIMTVRAINASASKIASGFVSVPSNAAFVRVSYRTFNDVSTKAMIIGLPVLMALDDYNRNANAYKSVSMYTTYAGYIDDDGSIKPRTYNTESYTDYIPYTMDKIGVVCQSDTAYPLWVSFAFYNSSKVFISRIRVINESASKMAAASTAVPAGTAYVRVTYRWFNDSSVKVNIFDSTLVEACSSINELSLTYIPNTTGYPVFVSREGIINNALENSRTGIEQVRDYGYDMVRIDVQFTSDGVPVLFHDSTLGQYLPVYDANGDPVTGGKISTYTYSQLQAYFFGSPTNTILGLEEAAQLIKKHGLSVMLELKDATKPTQANIETAYDILAKNGLIDRSLWCVYSLDVAEYVTDIDDTCDCGYIQETISQATIDIAAQMNTGKNKVFFCAYATSVEQFTDALHIYGAKNHVNFKIGSAYSISDIYEYRNFEMIEAANVRYPAYQLANYVE